MSKVMERMKEIVSKLPEDYFDNLDEYESVGVLIKLYLDKYGEDETTLIPGTNKHMNREFLLKLKDDLENDRRLDIWVLYKKLYQALIY